MNLSFTDEAWQQYISWEDKNLRIICPSIIYNVSNRQNLTKKFYFM